MQKAARKELIMALKTKHCRPCEGGTPPLKNEKEDKLLKQVGWEISRTGIHKISRQFVLKDFKEAIGFVNKVAEIAEQEQHHPNFYISYKKVTIELYTHAILGLSENDFIVAAKINALEG
jgi:4a-hydroxytetrahydrobiopterin dehydratase